MDHKLLFDRGQRFCFAPPLPICLPPPHQPFFVHFSASLESPVPFFLTRTLRFWHHDTGQRWMDG